MTSPALADLNRYGAARSEDEARAYIDPRDLVNGKLPPNAPRYPSVTSILKNVDKSGLTQWAVNLTAEWAAAHWMELGKGTEQSAFNRAKYRWKDYRNERASVGDGIHATIEAEHEGSWDFPELDDEQLLIMEQWRQLRQAHSITPLLSEFTVFNIWERENEKVGYAGTADGYWEIDGELCLVDIKTSKSTWPEHWYQLGALYLAPEWMIQSGENTWVAEPARKIDKIAIVHLRSDHAEILYKTIEEIEDYGRVFMAYYEVHASLERLNRNNKEREKKSAGF